MRWWRTHPGYMGFEPLLILKTRKIAALQVIPVLANAFLADLRNQVIKVPCVSMPLTPPETTKRYFFTALRDSTEILFRPSAPHCIKYVQQRLRLCSRGYGCAAPYTFSHSDQGVLHTVNLYCTYFIQDEHCQSKFGSAAPGMWDLSDLEGFFP